MQYLNPWYVYLVECNDKSLYCGITPYLYKRIQTHNDGKGSKYTRSRLPVKLKEFVEVESRGQALRIENMIKKQNKNKKIEVLRSYKEL